VKAIYQACQVANMKSSDYLPRCRYPMGSFRTIECAPQSTFGFPRGEKRLGAMRKNAVRTSSGVATVAVFGDTTLATKKTA
jgi:hypothetical protein